jgi:hypothetical protein
MKFGAFWGLCLIVFATFATSARAGAGIELSQPALYDLKHAGFELPRSTEVRIEAVGLMDQEQHGPLDWLTGRDTLSTYAWILDATTRQPVWTMDADDTSEVRDNSQLREARKTVQLDAGRYELYLFSGQAWTRRRDNDSDDDPSWWERMFGRDKRYRNVSELEDAVADCHVALTFDALTSQELGRFEATGAMQHALLQINQLGNTQFASAGFELTASTPLRIYALIEHAERNDDPADYGWIVNE